MNSKTRRCRECVMDAINSKTRRCRECVMDAIQKDEHRQASESLNANQVVETRAQVGVYFLTRIP